MNKHEKNQRRLAIRSWRRGMKEMDLILGGFWDAQGKDLDPGTLAHYEALLSENDQELYLWVTGAAQAPEKFADLIAQIARQQGCD